MRNMVSSTKNNLVVRVACSECKAEREVARYDIYCQKLHCPTCDRLCFFTIIDDEKSG